jgi:acyl-[acyl-carrier-protein] desaturase
MATPAQASLQPLEAGLLRLYRDFFDLAERKRRWSLRGDIPWVACNPLLDPAIADLVESFCAVELYLPDYVAKAMAIFRRSRACACFYANWGYEEAKHSLALAEWLLRSRMRSEEQMADLEGLVFERHWEVPHDSAVAMLCYAMTQELATGLTYRNLRRLLGEGRDPALASVLGFLGVDEQAHHSFFLKAVRLFLEHDRAGTLGHLRRVLHSFAMPAIYELADGRQRVEAIKALGVFNDAMYFRDVYQPILGALGVTRLELRRAG